MGKATTKKARKPASTSVAEINKLLKDGVKMQTINSRPKFKTDAYIKTRDKRWNYKGMSKALADLFSVAQAKRDEKGRVVKDINGNPCYTVNVMDICVTMVKWLVAYCCDKNFRKASRNDIFRLAKDMANNKWRLISNAIVISPRDFNVVDGQHRLIAFLLARTMNPKCQVPLTIEFADYDPAVIDTGKKRTLRDLFHGNKIPNSGKMSAAMQQVWAHFTGTAHANSSKTQGTHSLILDLLPTFKVDCHNAIKTVEKHNQRNGNERIGTQAKVAGLFAIFSMIDIETSDVLMSYMHRENGVRVPERIDRLVTTLRKGSAAKSDEKDYLNYRQLNAALIYAWNHVYAGKAMPSKAKWSDTKKNYPEIEGMKELALDLSFKSDNKEAIQAMIRDGRLYDKHLIVNDIVKKSIKNRKTNISYDEVAKKVSNETKEEITKTEIKTICRDLTKAKVVSVTPIATKVRFNAKKTAKVKA